MTATVLNPKISEVENKIPNTSNLATTNVLNTKISEVEDKIPNHDKYIPTPEFNKLTVESFTAILKQAYLVNKTDFDNITSFNRQITSNKTKHSEVRKKLNSLISKDYNFFLGRNYFTSNDVSQNTFAYHPTLDRLELKEDKGTDDLMMFLAGNQSEYSILKLRRCILFSCIT